MPLLVEPVPLLVVPAPLLVDPVPLDPVPVPLLPVPLELVPEPLVPVPPMLDPEPVPPLLPVPAAPPVLPAAPPPLPPVPPPLDPPPPDCATATPRHADNKATPVASFHFEAAALIFHSPIQAEGPSSLSTRKGWTHATPRWRSGKRGTTANPGCTPAPRPGGVAPGAATD
jgi:hypothetical protein